MYRIRRKHVDAVEFNLLTGNLNSADVRAETGNCDLCYLIKAVVSEGPRARTEFQLLPPNVFRKRRITHARVNVTTRRPYALVSGNVLKLVSLSLK